MSEAILRRYLDGWTRICVSTEDTVAAMISSAHPDIRFADVNSAKVHVGHDGLRAICSLATSIYDGARIAYRDLLFDGFN